MKLRGTRAAILILVVIVVAQATVIGWQYLELTRHRDSRPAGRMVTLDADLPVFQVTDGEQVFVIPKGCRVQHSTPQRLAQPLERGGDEFIVVLRTSGGPRGSAIINPRPGDEWMDDYRVEGINAR
jgi:hypothetical protein